jgi:hypothetical protein
MHELPEDLTKWPHSSHAILGVSSDSTPEELRRAWLRLVRRFKPDQFPQHFQRLRTAFDDAQQQRRYDDDDDNCEVHTSDAWSWTSSEFSSESSPSDQVIRRERMIETGAARNTLPSAEIRQLLEQGELDLARLQLDFSLERFPKDAFLNYCRLLLLHVQEPPSNSNAELRLKTIFNLVEAASDVDLVRRWLEWELVKHPQMAKSSLWDGFMSSYKDLRRIWPLVELRWMGLGWSGAQLVVDDIRKLAVTTAIDDETWYTMLIRSVDFTVWHNDSFFREHEAFVERNVDSRFSWSQQESQLDRFDQRINQGQIWRNLRQSQRRHTVEVVPDACTLHPLLLLPPLASICTSAARSPLAFLETHDALQSSCAGLLKAALQGIVLLDSYNGAYRQVSTYCAPSLVKAFFGHYANQPYRALRLPLVNYCQTYGITIQAFARTADSLQDMSYGGEPDTWSLVVDADINLRLLERLLRLTGGRSGA